MRKSNERAKRGDDDALAVVHTYSTVDRRPATETLSLVCWRLTLRATLRCKRRAKGKKKRKKRINYSVNVPQSFKFKKEIDLL